MRELLPKSMALSIATLVLGGALALTPAIAGIYNSGGGGGGMGGSYHAVGGGIGGTGGSNHPVGGGIGGTGGSFNPASGAIGGTGGSFSPVGGPSSHGFVPGNHVPPAGNAAPQVRWIPHAGQAWTGGPNRVTSFAHRRHYYRHARGGGVFLPGYCDDGYYDCNNGYTYDQDACWVLRRVYNKYGKFVGWRRVYICAN